MVALKGEIALSNGSACTSASYTPSHVLKAMGLPDEEIMGALRFPWCHLTPQGGVERGGGGDPKGSTGAAGAPFFGRRFEDFGVEQRGPSRAVPNRRSIKASTASGRRDHHGAAGKNRDCDPEKSRRGGRNRTQHWGGTSTRKRSNNTQDSARHRAVQESQSQRTADINQELVDELTTTITLAFAAKTRRQYSEADALRDGRRIS